MVGNPNRPNSSKQGRRSKKSAGLPLLDPSQGLSVSRPMSAAGERAKTVVIPGFDSEKVADFWIEKYAKPCPFFNALEKVHVGKLSKLIRGLLLC